MNSQAAPTILVIEDYSDTRELLSVCFVAGGITSSKRRMARRIHEMPKLSQIPIFVISAYLTEEIQADLRALGRVGMSRKPFDADVLLENIRVTLNIHR